MYTIINVLLINTVLLLFPLVIYLFHFAHAKNTDKEQSSTLLDFSLLSAVYLFYTHCRIENNVDFIVMMNLPLIIAYIKNRSFVSVIMSVFIVCINYYSRDINLVVLVIEYLIFYLVYLVTNKKKRRVGLILATIVVSESIITLFFINNYTLYQMTSNILTLLACTVIAYLIIYIFEMGEDIIKLHLTSKELEQEKQIIDSLFKITHEIKNPIAVCKSYLDMFDFNNEDHEGYIPIVREEIDKTLLLLQDFLSMNKIKIQKEILDINLLLEDIIGQFETVLRSKNIKLDYDIKDEEIYIEGDYNRLSQVLINIIKNAIEAADVNKDSKISLFTELDSSNIKIIVLDNGVGMDEERLEKIKEPFYTTKKNGTGLGVSLSCNIIEAHEGTINFSSKLYEWTKVEITLPISDFFN